MLLATLFNGFTSSEKCISSRVAFDEPSPRLVWMVIDALRADFTSVEGAVPFLDKMKESGCIRSYVAIAEPPTVTLPRVKVGLVGYEDYMLEHPKACMFKLSMLAI